MVTITADPAEAGKEFDKREVIYGGVTVADVNSATTTFIMGDEDVKLRATYKDAAPEHTHSYGDWKSDAENHWKECDCSDKTELAAHTFEWKIDREATKTETGLRHEECSVCGFKRNENTVIDKLPSGDVPETGDASQFFGWIVLLLISGGVVLGTAVYGKKRKESEAE